MPLLLPTCKQWIEIAPLRKAQDHNQLKRYSLLILYLNFYGFFFIRKWLIFMNHGDNPHSYLKHKTFEWVRSLQLLCGPGGSHAVAPEFCFLIILFWLPLISWWWRRWIMDHGDNDYENDLPCAYHRKYLANGRLLSTNLATAPEEEQLWRKVNLD